MPDVIYPYRLAPPAQSYGTKGELVAGFGELFWVSTMYLGKASLAEVTSNSPQHESAKTRIWGSDWIDRLSKDTSLNHC